MVGTMIKIPSETHGIVYVRVSTAHQAEDELPIDSQIAELKAAVTAAGATCEVVTDAGISGTDFEHRPGLQDIVARAREPKPNFKWVLVWKLSRFGRDIEEGLIYRAVLRKKDIELISYKEPIPEGPLGQLITHVLMAVDQFYAAATAADVLRSQKELARQGFSAGGRPPVGYRREPLVVGTRYDGTPLTRVRWVPDPDAAPRVVQAFQMAAEGVGYDEIVAATHICRNKSSLATILANPMYRGVKVFNRETRVEGEHGRKRRRNVADEMVTSEVDPIVPDQLWNRVQELLARRREHRLAPQRYAGGYVLTDILRCACGARMAGTNSRSYRYYRCVARCGRPHVRADLLDSGVMDLIRRTLITPRAIREMIDAINEHGRLRAENQAPDLQRVQRQIASLEKQDANLRHALRIAKPNAAERIALEIDKVAAEMRQAVLKRDELEQVRKPLSTSQKFVQQTMDEMTGLIENSALDTRVAWVRDLLDRVTVDGREEHAVAIWRTASDDGVNRSDSVSSWLRR
jgi:site-specific DNA recombinase